MTSLLSCYCSKTYAPRCHTRTHMRQHRSGLRINRQEEFYRRRFCHFVPALNLCDVSFIPLLFFKLTLSPISLHPNRSHLCNGYLCFECSSTIFNYFLNLHSLPSFLCNTNFSSPTSFLFSSQSSRSLISILILLRFNLFLNSFPQVRFLSSALLSLSLSLSLSLCSCLHESYSLNPITLYLS